MEQYKLFPFIQSLTENELEIVKESFFLESYKKGDIIYDSASQCKGLLVVLKGNLRTYMLSDEGREVTLFKVSETETCVLSASCLMEAIDFDVFAQAMDDVELLVLPSNILNSIMQNNKDVSLYMYKSATEKFSDVMWSMQQVLFRKIDQRIAGFVWDEVQQSKKLEINYTHEEIAKLIGSAREVVSRVLKDFADEGIIELQRGKILVVDQTKLKKIL